MTIFSTAYLKKNKKKLINTDQKNKILYNYLQSVLRISTDNKNRVHVDNRRSKNWLKYVFVNSVTK